MKINCLIIEPDHNNQIEYKLLFNAFTDTFQPTVVTDVQSAVKTLEVSKFSIIICDPLIVEQHIDKLQQFQSRTHFPAPILFVYSNNFNKNKFLVNSSELTELIKRPLTPTKLGGQILVALKNKFFQGTMTGFHLTAVLQLIELDNLTCTLRLSTTDYSDEGVIFFDKGIPLDAQYGNLQTDMALRRMFSLKKTDIKMYTICPMKENRLQTNCSKMILDYFQEQPEAASPKKPDKSSVTGIASLFIKVKKTSH